MQGSLPNAASLSDGEQADTRKERFVGVDLPEDLWVLAKSTAALANMPLKQFVAEALELRIEKHNAEQPKRKK
jgi:hypothetical protein